MLRWEKKDNKVLLRVVSHDVVAADSLPVHEAVVNSNFEPVLYSFEIKAFKKDFLSPAQGIEDWQIAFEAAGFKNAIIAKDPPTV